MSDPEFDIVIRGGSVVDGDGSPIKEADVAILGDRIRLQDSFLNPNIFVRSIPNYRADGGVSPLVGVVTSLLAACDYEIVLVESVGVGQNEFDLACISDILIVALVPVSGD